ncbi:MULTISPECIES: thiamine/thiamine pyrophosphate ABC transporter permease [unclassified Gilliamella]|uniref:thiamine/thiamine pyrophosphate ABC transporter permease n=1 Tax=unclassified Gilliamella TaxID=2685620 RepID=UPI001326695F|nr:MULTISPECIES: thiamine/thiamine pyrophosphate ABC transporter permease [unclassified Gilliamella]MWN32077.1 thiamine/thiamine pyrophosphate ABC transporter, permease protein [Gilliamella sp. Pra-s60]MWP29336.1 thiamine/thiamine pyrophosphate ABC transporter, permease protein [Gilliamella sp. Pra-s54]
MLKLRTLLPGISAASLILIVLGAVLFALCIDAIKSNNLTVYFDSYLLHVIWVTTYQATLSTLLSVLLAILMAKALSMVNFWGKGILLRIMPITFILPTLVVITGLLSIYGQHGLLASIFDYFGMPFLDSIYGLKGILLAHVFLNFPYACCLFYQTLNSVPNEQKQLAAQLNFSSFFYFKLIEWPLLRRQLLPMATLIFMLCFSSFSIPLALGGGPKYSTLEVAIYQAIRDFDLVEAVILACFQLVYCAIFMCLMQKINHSQKINVRYFRTHYRLPVSWNLALLCMVIVIIGGLFILLPIVIILVEGICSFKWVFLTMDFQRAIMFSLLIAFGSAIIAMLLALLLLYTNSRLLINQQTRWSNRLMLVGSLILVIPSMVLASGLFLLLFPFAYSSVFVCGLMMLCNGLMALPFILKNLAMPMYDVTSRYWQLSQSLNINGFLHFYLIEYKALKKLIVQSFAFAAILSLGDFGIIALFGGQSVTTLPYYLYEQISHYHYQESTVTAALLLILSFSLLIVIDYDRTE